MAMKRRTIKKIRRISLLIIIAVIIGVGLFFGVRKAMSYINRDKNEAQVITVVEDPEKEYVATVVLDAGHGGDDTGLTDGTNNEKDINLAIVALIGQKLEDNNIHAVYTRTSDSSTLETSTYNNADGTQSTDDSRARAEYATTTNADYTVSIHMNCIDSSPANGYAIYVHQGHPDSIDLAKYIDFEMSSISSLESLGARNGYSLREIQLNTSPAVEIVLGNLNDMEYLASTDGEKEVADAIAEGIINKVSTGLLYDTDTYESQADLY